MDLCGRKFAFMITAVPFSVGWPMIGFGKNVGLLIAERFFSGIGVGMTTLLVPVSAISYRQVKLSQWNKHRIINHTAPLPFRLDYQPLLGNEPALAPPPRKVISPLGGKPHRTGVSGGNRPCF